MKSPFNTKALLKCHLYFPICEHLTSKTQVYLPRKQFSSLHVYSHHIHAKPKAKNLWFKLQCSRTTKHMFPHTIKPQSNPLPRLSHLKKPLANTGQWPLNIIYKRSQRKINKNLYKNKASVLCGPRITAQNNVALLFQLFWRHMRSERLPKRNDQLETSENFVSRSSQKRGQNDN